MIRRLKKAISPLYLFILVVALSLELKLQDRFYGEKNQSLEKKKMVRHRASVCSDYGERK